MIECVPNVSEGRRLDVVESLAQAIARTRGVRLLDRSADTDHHRSVFTFVGDAESLVEAVLAIYARAIPSIDLRTHRGTHPRIGAVDVVPFVPLASATLEQCVALARRVGLAVAERFRIPVYLYEAAAARPELRDLAVIRRGGLEGLTARMSRPEWAPDFGPASPHPTAGASAVGARQVLIAFNVNLANGRLEDAQAIAAAIRERDGGLPALKAIGLHLPARGVAQVSMNLTDHRRTNMATAFDAVRREAQRRGIEVLESELVGLAPQAAFGGVSPGDLLLTGFTRECLLEERLRAPG